MTLVLIVEDHEKNLKLARDVLRAKGYDTVEARSGEEGLALARARNPDLVLMDIQLPGISGIEAFRQLRARPDTAGIPVVALTASVTPSDRSQITAAGFDAFVSKPIDLREFLDTVERLVRT